MANAIVDSLQGCLQRWPIASPRVRMGTQSVDDRQKHLIVQRVLRSFATRGRPHTPECQSAQKVDACPFRNPSGRVDLNRPGLDGDLG